MHEHLEELLIPVTGKDGGYFYILLVDSKSEVITAAEAQIIRSYIEYICGPKFYGAASLEQFIARHSGPAQPYAAIGGHNTVTLLKRSDYDWRHNCHTWRVGPRYMPHPETGYGEALSLLRLLDHIETTCGEVSSKWIEWKRDNPEIFLEAEIAAVRLEKERAMDRQDYDAAAQCRDREKDLLVARARLSHR